jgi:hypothetical protein
VHAAPPVVAVRLSAWAERESPVIVHSRGSQGTMIAYAGLRPSPTVTGRHEIGLYGAAHPSQRGRALGRECFIATVGVTKAARNRGIASALLGRSLARSPG